MSPTRQGLLDVPKTEIIMLRLEIPQIFCTELLDSR